MDVDAAARFDAALAIALRTQWNTNVDLRDSYFTALTAGVRSKAATSGGGGGGGAGGGGGGGGGVSTGSAPLARVGGKDLLAAVERGVVTYEREERELNLVLFADVLTRLVSVDRLLTRAGGCALLVGAAGVGRRSAATLAAHLHGFAFVSPGVGRGYGLKSFLAELKGVLATAGIAGEEAVLYLEDHHFADDAVLESVNSLLSSGEVPGMYTHEELEPLLAPLKEAMGESGVAYRTPYDFFLSRVQANLHVCIGMDPGHPEFGVRCERNPALFTRCGVVWMGAWSKAAMSEVAVARLGEVTAAAAAHVAPEVLPELAVAIHTTFMPRGACPRDFVALLAALRGIYTTKVGGSFKEVDRLRAGLAKLEEAQTTVDDLSRAAGAQREQLKTKQAAADRAMNDITEALALASDRKKEVEVLAKSLASAEAETRGRKAAIEEQLADVMPLVERAKSAVGAIKRENLDEIRSLKMPPEAVADVLSAVLLLLGVTDTSWQSMKKFLGGRGVKEDIMGFDAHRITPKIRAAVGRLMREKGDSFEKETITRASVAAAPLADWVSANIQYSETLEKIAPLEGELAGASAELERSQAALDLNKAELAELDARVQALKDEFGARTAEAEALRQALARTEDTLRRATALLSELAGERGRWAQRVEELTRAQASLPLHATLAAATTTYLGRCGEDVRGRALHDWRRLVGDAASRMAARNAKYAPAAAAFAASRFDALRFLSSESETLRWRHQGLPADTLSVENAVIILAASHAARVPFIVDPSNQAAAWLAKVLEADKGSPLEVLNAQDPRFQNAVELAIRFGKTLLIREVDRVDPMLYPVMRRDFVHQGPRYVVQVADKVVDVSDKFRLFLATRNPRPALSPDGAALVSEVNFTVTASGLESQLLGATIQHEQPELEARKSELLRREEELKVQLVEVEDGLLAALAQSTGNILDNAALLASLAAAKSKSAEISRSLEGSEKATRELDEQRNGYRPFAAAGSTLYFAVQGLAAINSMYQYSLATFLTLFKASLSAARAGAAAGGDAMGIGGGALEDRIWQLRRDLEVRVLMHVGQSLLKEDRLTFALHLVHAMHPDLFGAVPTRTASPTLESVHAGGGGAGGGGDEAGDTPEWRFFMGEVVGADEDAAGGGGGGGLSGRGTRDLPLWAARDRGDAFRTFTSTFPALARDLAFGDSERWGRWATSSVPEREWPPAVAAATTPFVRLLLVSVLRPDRLLSAMQAFVAEGLGVPSINPPAVTIARLAEESAATVPILMITTTGADPTRDLAEYAAATVGREAYAEMAMGGGSAGEAITRLRKAAADGGWLCFKNLHLVTPWLTTLEKEFNALTPHPRFRLWLTTECHPAFPSVLLQSSLKVTFEAPPGVRKNMERTYEAWGADYVERGSATRAQLLFLLAWLNAVVQERRTYVPQGWTKAYEFSFADLRAGASVVDGQLARSGDRVPWAFLHGLIENTVYGGRVDNASDLRVLRAYLATVFHPDVLTGRGGRTVARGVTLPTSPKYGEYLAAVEALPDVDPPYLFGLPDNIDRSVQRFVSSRVLASLKSMRALVEGPSSFNRDVWRARLAPVMEAWERLTGGGEGAAPTAAAPAAAGGAAVAGADVDPVASFVGVEAALAARLVGRVTADVAALRKVLTGGGMLTPAILTTAAALLADSVPESWETEWEGPETPIAWLQGLVSRQRALSRWAAAATAGTLLNAPLALGDLFRPATFLNAVRQRTARSLRSGGGGGSGGVGLDGLRLVSAWNAEALRGASVIVRVTGLAVQGAGFDAGRQVMVDVAADASELQPMPDMLLAWVGADFPDPIPAASALSVPVYQSLDRSRLVMDLALPAGTEKAKWVLAGVALFVQA